MSRLEHLSNHAEDAGGRDLAGQHEIRDVLAALQRLAEQTSHPVVRACLEQAHDDILHLTADADEPQSDDEPAAA